MKKMWMVKLVRPPVPNHYRDGFFPRKFYYKWEAEELARNINHNGGEAAVEREK